MRGRGHEEPARLGEDLDVLREQAVDLAVDDSRQFAERLHAVVIRRGETAADVEQVHLRVAAVFGFLEEVGGEVERGDVVLEVRGLAADVEAQALDDQARLVRGEDEVHGFAGRGAELRGQLDHRAGVGHLEAQREPGLRGVLLDLLDLLVVVVGDQRLVRVQLLQRLVGLDGIGVDDLVPDPILPLLVGHVLDVLIDDAELRHRGHVETRARLVKRLDDGGIGVGLDRVVGLDAGQVLLERARSCGAVGRGPPRTAACRVPRPVS